MEDPARVLGQPTPHLGVLVGGIVVEDHVDHLAGRHGALDGIEEADELLVAVALHALADEAAVEHVEGREQRGRAVALVIMGHGAGTARLHRQARLGAVERLDLALLVDRQHHGMRRRIDIQPDDVLDLRGEVGIGRELENLDEVGAAVPRISYRPGGVIRWKWGPESAPARGGWGFRAREASRAPDHQRDLIRSPWPRTRAPDMGTFLDYVHMSPVTAASPGQCIGAAARTPAGRLDALELLAPRCALRCVRREIPSLAASAVSVVTRAAMAAWISASVLMLTCRRGP